MPSKKEKQIKEESWSSFHKKHHSPDFFYSSCTGGLLKKQCYCPALPLCLTEAQDDDDSKRGGWLSDLLDIFDTPKSMRKLGSDDDSFASGDSLGKKKRNLFRKQNSTRRQGNVKLDSLSFR